MAATDGTTIVYQVAGRLWTYDPATDRSREVPIEVGSPRGQRQPRFVPADRYLGDYQLDKTGKRVVLDTRGKLFSFAPFDGPVLQLGLSQGARYRLASFLGDGAEVVTVSDGSGKETIEIHRTPGPTDASPGNVSRANVSRANVSRANSAGPMSAVTVAAAQLVKSWTSTSSGGSSKWCPRPTGRTWQLRTTSTSCC